jgi:hypothetical protein
LGSSIAPTDVADLIHEAEPASTAAGEASDAAHQRSLSLRLVAGQLAAARGATGLMSRRATGGRRLLRAERN